MYGDQPTGAPGYYGDPHATAPKNGLAVVALVLGILGLLTCWIVVGLLPAIVGLILGIVALGRVRKGRATNRGTALAALIIGILATIASIVFTAVYAWLIYVAWDNGGAEYAQCIANAGADQAAVQQCEQEYGNDILERFGIDPNEVERTA